MKFHAVALCLAGTMAAGMASADDHNDRAVRDRNVQDEQVMHSPYPGRFDAYTGRGIKSRKYTQVWPSYNQDARTVYEPHGMVPGHDTYSYDFSYVREAIYPDLPTLTEVAARIEPIIQHNRHEAAMLRGLAARARTAGWENIAMVYDHMAMDHDRGATMATTWLVSNEFPTPADPTVTLAADMSPEMSVDHMIDMHVKSFNDSLAKLKGEKSSTVRGMLLMSAATSARHITLLRTLDKDVEMGRRNLSARITELISGPLTTTASSQWVDEWLIEERNYYTFPTTTYTYTPEVAVEVTPAPAPVVVERIVERPVIVERIVERPVVTQPTPAPVFIERIPETPVRSTVAGRRQTTRARRPAK